MNNLRPFFVVLPLTAVLMFQACKDEGSPVSPAADTGVLTYVQDIRPIFALSSYGCFSCHSGSSPYAGLDLSADTSLFVNIPSRTGGSCATKMIVMPGDPSESTLYLRINGTACGAIMPFGATSPVVSVENRQKIALWIQQGALNN